MTVPSELAAGAVLPARTLPPQTRTDIVRYQGASGDFNPVHHDDDFARSGGMPGAFSVGMLQAGLLATYCTDLFGATAVRRFAVRFAEQVWPGDVLTCAGVVREVRDEAGARVAELDLAISRADGGVAVSGTATVRLED
ncbi:hypothetical protein EFK50_11325 [Nocardioides marmoriginsengisoli]|uniref:MaoC-like domain-containing protein n=1 Tax=Nocardioides marmoriginsengisoli TaxID=661483 RepID=A0A3N0CGK6_9ACTN|nr:MaoC/PaaZ C-terminal domain-containing protein [Nocardioides marmoriginsengisoli]RNL62361.1 hypothetical protein EFK50_11325 [Nocardioides marmoriginsengisoli]